MMPDIKPNAEIHLRMTGNDIRRSYFLEFLHGDLVAIAQPDPPVNNSHLTKVIYFTYCVANKQTQRLGFEARIETITPDHRILLRKISEPFVCDLRLWRRVCLDVLPGTRVFLENREIQLIDISGGGAHVVLPSSELHMPPADSTMLLKFVFEKGEVLAETSIIRQWTDDDGARHIAVKFSDQDEIRKMIY